MDIKQLGRRLRQLRLKKFGPNQSYAQFQEVSGVSRGSVGMIEKGLSEPSFNTVEKWLLACGMTPAEFYGAPSSDDFPEVPFKFAPDDIPFHEQLQQILDVRDPELSNALEVTLRAIGREAREITQRARASPLPPSGGAKKQGRVTGSRRSSNLNIDGKEDTGT